MKKFMLLAGLFLTFFMGCSIDAEENGNKNVEEKLVVYPVPAGTPQKVVAFSVKANGIDAGVYSDTNGWGNPVNFSYFHINEGTQVKVEIEPDFDFTSWKILPERLAIKADQKGKVISFTVSKAPLDITIVFDNNYQGKVFHLFVSPVDSNPPDTNSGNVTYFGPGYHDLYQSDDGRLVIYGANKTVYIAPGAVVNGTILFYETSNASIRGGGVLMMSAAPPAGDAIPLVFMRASNSNIKGIIVNSRIGSWSTAINSITGMTVDNYHVVSPTYASTDAFNIQSGQGAVNNVNIKNSFLRASDDTISIKGSGDAATSAGWKAIEGITMENCILWSDANNAMVVGEESAAKYYKNITFNNIDVLYSYDDKNNHTSLNERSAMSIVCLEGTYFSDITWSNIRVNNCQRLICLTFLDSFWFGSIQGNQKHPGGMSGITFSNITSVSPNSSSIANEILLSGYTANGLNQEKYIEDITFDNVKVNGQKVTASYSRLVTNDHVRDLVFK